MDLLEFQPRRKCGRDSRLIDQGIEETGKVSKKDLSWKGSERLSPKVLSNQLTGTPRFGFSLSHWNSLAFSVFQKSRTSCELVVEF